MSYRKSSSNPVRLHLTISDAEDLRDVIRGTLNWPLGQRLADRLDARIKEAKS